MNIIKFKRRVILAFAALLMVGCSDKPAPSEQVGDQTLASAQPAELVSEKFEQLLDDYYEASLALDPVGATFTGDTRYNHKFVNYLSVDVEQQLKAHYKKYQTALTVFDDADLTASEKMSKATLQWELDINQAELSFDSDLTPIDQMWSINLTMGQLASGSSAQPFATVGDYQNWLIRVDEYLEWLASAQSKMQEGIKLGYVLPKSLIKKVIPQLASMAQVDLEKHLFYKPALSLPDDFSDEDADNIREQYQTMVENKVVPAYQALLDFMNGDYLAAGRDSSGIDAMANGQAYYQHQIKRYTTTDMSADQIHQLGLAEVARILAEMEEVKTQVAYSGDLKSFFNYVRENGELMPYSEPRQIIEHFNEIHTRMQPQVEKLFDLKPKTPFEVRRTEAFRENSASAEYNPGSLDGTRPGIFYTPIPDASKYNIYDSESLFLHEAIPGHHYQISLTQESEVLPKFRKTLWYSGYGEGWALYTESLGKELGLYTDPYQYFGMLSAEMHRAIRLVVDTGLHSKGWTREQAIEYSLENEAESADSIEREIERYMANPGQALAYKIGQLKIRELRAMAEQALGDKFEIAQFHNQVLETGCVPLALLESKIKAWVASEAEA